MVSTPEKGIRMPRSRKPALERALVFAETHEFTSQLNPDDGPNTSPPRTPDLEWSETPPATEDPPTPENDLDPDDVIHLPCSPLAARKTTLEQPINPLHTLSQLDADVPEELLPQLFSATSRSKSLFQNDFSRVISTVSSQLQPPPSADNTPSPPLFFIKVDAAEGSSFGPNLQPFYDGPKGTGSRNDAIWEYAASGSVHTVAAGIKHEDRSTPSGHIVATEIETKPITTTSATELSRCLAKKKPLSLSLAWSLSTMLSTILPLEAVERFADSPSKCIATTKEGMRCKNSVARTANQSFVAELSKALAALECSFDFGAFAEHMKPLIEGITCTRWHRAAVSRCLKELCSYSWRPLKTATTKPHQANAISNSIESTFKLWISALMVIPTIAEGIVLPMKEDEDNVRGSFCSVTAPSAAAVTKGTLTYFQYASPIPTTKSSERNLPATNKNTTIASRTTATEHQVAGSMPVRLSTHLNHDLVEFPYSKGKRDTTPQDLIRQTLVKRLTPADMRRAGYIYVFWHPGSLGYVKIGYSTDVEKRLQAWRDQCKFSLEQHRGMATPRVFHLHRIESLIHAELKDYRRFEKSCRGCGKSHIEWFEVDPSYALKVVAKWTSQSFYSGRTLDPSISAEEIDRLCELTEADTYLPRLRPKKVKGNSRRSISGRHRGVK